MATLINILSQAEAELKAQGIVLPEIANVVDQNLPATLQALAREVAESRQLRHHLLTDPSNTTVTLAAGAADLTALIASGVLLDKLKAGEITHPDNPLPLEWFNSKAHAALDGGLDSLFIGCWLEGTTLKTKVISDVALAGNLSFRVPFIPTLAQLPDALTGKLVTMLVERMMTGRNERNGNDN